MAAKKLLQQLRTAGKWSQPRGEAAALARCRTDDDGDDGLCVICMEAAAAILFQPCLHAVACAACALKIAARSNECPMCRSHVQSAVPIAAGFPMGMF